jgi:hypothetical protein
LFEACSSARFHIQPPLLHHLVSPKTPDPAPYTLHPTTQSTHQCSWRRQNAQAAATSRYLKLPQATSHATSSIPVLLAPPERAGSGAAEAGAGCAATQHQPPPVASPPALRPRLKLEVDRNRFARRRLPPIPPRPGAVPRPHRPRAFHPSARAAIPTCRPARLVRRGVRGPEIPIHGVVAIVLRCCVVCQ